MYKAVVHGMCMLMLALVPVAGWAAPADDGEITAPQARRALQTLQDEAQREEVVRTLETIAAGPDADSNEETDGEPADEENGQAAAAEESPIANIVPLEEGGLIARTLEQVGQWADSLAELLARLGNALTELPAWFEATFVSEVGRALLLQVLTDLAIVFGIGLGLEWLLRRVLRKGAQTLIDTADEADQRPPAPRRPVEPIASSSLAEQAVAGLRPIQDGTALVHVQRDGVEQVESVAVGVVNSGADPATAPEPAQQIGTGHPSARTNKAEPELTALRHLPFAFASFVLDLLPLGLFFGIAALTLHFLPGLDSRTHEVTSEFVMAYVITRITMAVVRLLASPTRYSLRIARISDGASQLLHRWARGLVVLATFGVALANAVEILGTGPSARLLIIKSVSLLAHIAVVVLVFRIRHRVGALIAGPQDRSGTWSVLRRWLARIWPYLASMLVMGSWLIRTMHIEDGFPRLIEFVGISGAIIVLGRLVAVLALGALGRLVDEDEEAEQAQGLRHRLAEDYYPLLRALVIFIIAAGTLLALLQAWGLNALAWFAPGTIGGSLASAALTILVAVILAIIVWQTTNATIDRRINLWRQQGDTVRAARLRTLLPMLRSGLMVVIVLVVGFTALSQIGINTTPLLAGASIIGVAVGFGSQKLVQDFITGIFLLMENAMQVGDWVTVAGVSGTVENLSIRTVRLRAGDGSLHIVPFSSVSTVNNTTRGLGNAAVRISVRYDTDINQAIAELKAIGAGLRSDPAFEKLIIADLEVWGVDAVDGSLFTLAGQMRCVDKGRWGVQREMNRRILERFRELGIHVADPRERLVGSIKTR
ncbi:mechanosensitive ion channel family protein [Pseudomonas sp. OIL-1]|uniref:mechanosensitive ion channel family protein n=1 Tax=Pseudomonas sp. OIL-1 TaxID=2706126 RepID=UPI002114B605|nr:mechanosensitive ion channel domain-containing protein [Pseudomonas sp. OIL-1]